MSSPAATSRQTISAAFQPLKAAPVAMFPKVQAATSETEVLHHVAVESDIELTIARFNSVLCITYAA